MRRAIPTSRIREATSGRAWAYARHCPVDQSCAAAAVVERVRFLLWAAIACDDCHRRCSLTQPVAAANPRHLVDFSGYNPKKPAASDALQNLVRTLKPDDLPVNTRKDMIALFTQLEALDRAFTLANQSLDLYAREGTVGSAWGVLWIPEMRPFRQDARFQAFVTRLKLMDYWKAFGPPDGCDLKKDRLICD